MKNHAKDNPYYYAVCGKGFIFLNHLKRHMKGHVGDNSYLFILCGKRFISWNHLKRHMKSHAADNTYHCDDGFIFWNLNVKG